MISVSVIFIKESTFFPISGVVYEKFVTDNSHLNLFVKFTVNTITITCNDVFIICLCIDLYHMTI